ncbi:hypothetical protein J4411_01975 [Candidatus Pacearchaeota archaeon]|nr:hypothetical protein [Candidatus Pacearchaeota archaeon]
MLPLTNLIEVTLSSILSIAVTLFVFGFIGYKISRKKKTVVKSGKAGAWAGIIAGLISAVLGILSFYLFPERIAEILQAAAQQGIDTNASMTIIQIGIYLNIIILPLIYAAIGALFSWLGFFIFKKK